LTEVLEACVDGLASQDGGDGRETPREPDFDAETQDRMSSDRGCPWRTGPRSLRAVLPSSQALIVAL